MCGVIGYIGNGDATKIIYNGLLQLEYRGYDSAGVALVDQNNNINIFKKEGRVTQLNEIIKWNKKSNLGFGHTRWSTHGKPNDINSHPHTSINNKYTIVHNRVIDNYKELKQQYLKNITFKSETDTEVIANLIEYFKNKENTIDAIKKQ